MKSVIGESNIDATLGTMDSTVSMENIDNLIGTNSFIQNV